MTYKDNTIRHYYEQAMLQGFGDLENLIEFLLIKKEVIRLDSDVSELDLYFKPNNRKRMNQLLNEYKERG